MKVLFNSIQNKQIKATFLAAFLFFTCITTTQALTLTPIRLELSGDPGQKITQEISLINEKNTSETFYSSYANFEAQGESGSPSFTTPTSDIGTWMSVAPSITVPAGKTVVTTLTINIPRSADAGGHFGVVFFGTTPNNQSGKVSIGAKTGVLVLLSVSGDVKEGGGLLSFNTKNKQFFYNTLPVSFEYRFKNDGGDRIKPEGKVRILNTLFIPADRLNANPVSGNVLPGSTRRFEFDWIKNSDITKETHKSGFGKFMHTANYQWKNFAFGLYSAHMKVSYGTQNLTAKDTTWFLVFPWQLLIVIIIVLVVGYFIGKKLLRRYNAYILKKAGILSKNNSSQ